MTGKRVIAKTRVCRRCGNVSTFTSSNPWAKVCDACLANPAHGFTPDREVKWARARNIAVRALVERHREEYAALLADARAGIEVEGWAGATLKEIDDFERRREEAWRERQAEAGAA